MKTLIAIVLIVLGGVLFYQGYNRKNSLAGETAEASTRVANSIDGKSRIPRHVMYMVGGGALVLIGIGMAVSRPAAPLNR